MLSLFPLYLAIEIVRDTRKGTERVTCLEFDSEEGRAQWISQAPAFHHRQRIDTIHPAARGARFKAPADGSSERPALQLQPTPGPRQRKAPAAPRPAAVPSSLDLFS